MTRAGPGAQAPGPCFSAEDGGRGTQTTKAQPEKSAQTSIAYECGATPPSETGTGS